MIKRLFSKKGKEKVGDDDLFVIKHDQIKNRQLKDPAYRSDWTEESFLSGSNSNEIVGKNFNYKLLVPLVVLMSFLLFFLLARVAYLQVVKGDYYYNLAEGNRIRIKNLEPNRGIIYDRNLNPLLRNTANFVLYLTPIDLPVDELERDELIREIAEILNEGEVDSEKPWFMKIKDDLDAISLRSLEAYNPLYIVDNLDRQTAMKLYLQADRTPGVSLQIKTKRQYFLSGNEEKQADKDVYSQEEKNIKKEDLAIGSSMSHILGYTGIVSGEDIKNNPLQYSPIDYIGKTGIENFWESSLKGFKGKKHIEVDALGREKKVISREPAEDGYNLVLTIDLELQKKVEEVLRRYLQKLDLKKGSVVVLNPNTGEVLSLVSWPSYDNNYFVRGIKASEYKKFLGMNKNHFLIELLAVNFLQVLLLNQYLLLEL